MKEMENGDDERIDTAYVFNWLQLRMGKGKKGKAKRNMYLFFFSFFILFVFSKIRFLPSPHS
jgi:hypothetical protein